MQSRFLTQAEKNSLDWHVPLHECFENAVPSICPGSETPVRLVPREVLLGSGAGMRIGVALQLRSGMVLAILLAGPSALPQDRAKEASADWLNSDLRTRFGSAKLLRQAGRFDEALAELTLISANPFRSGPSCGSAHLLPDGS